MCYNVSANKIATGFVKHQVKSMLLELSSSGIKVEWMNVSKHRYKSETLTLQCCSTTSW